jgi:predicted TIM-barrel fold metal-dependent hydrolase
MVQENANNDSTAFTLIDADVHNAVSVAEVLPHLSAYWRDVLKHRGRFASGPLHPSPVGADRKDAAPPSGGAPGSDPAFMLTHHFDAYNIDLGILNGSGIVGISLTGDSDYGNAVASAYNDVLIEKWLAHSLRFLGSLLINHSDPVAAAKEIERVGSHPQIVQVLMASGSNRLFGQRFFHPIYEAAQRMGLPVAVHPGTEGTGIAGPPTPAGYPSRYMEWHNILPINYMATVNSLVCEGVFEKFPGLKFVAIEGGIAWLPHLMWRMDKNYKALRSTTPWLKRLPSEYIRDHIRLTTQPIEEPENPQHILQIFEMMDAKHTVMFSSDYPHWDFDNPKMALPPLKGELKQRILWKNAAELYNLGDRLGEAAVGEEAANEVAA